MTRSVVPSCGFGWSYEVRDQTPRVVTPGEIGGAEWFDDQTVRRREHPSWTCAAWPI